MESQGLQSASKYLNNLLLARGLLQNGKAIDFTHSTNGSDSNAAVSRTINLVHELVLRRDRDAEQREIFATTIRTLRAEESQRVLDLQRVQDKNAELTREMAIAEARARALRASSRKAESQAKDLKEQMLKMKSMMDQVRAKCVSDVKQRDVEIERLKNHISGSQRGRRNASGKKGPSVGPEAAKSASRDARPDINGTDWALEKETNELLTALVNETSTENVALRAIVNNTIETLKSLTGVEKEVVQEEREEEKDGIGIPGQYRNSRKVAEETAQEVSLVSCETMAANMDAILEHCKNILRDPSFVPIEEVEIREEEIVKLRKGWERMASRWKEAVTMMNIWRKRMLDSGDSVHLKELSDLGFGRSVAVLPNGQPVLGQDEEVSSILFDTSNMEGIGPRDETEYSSQQELRFDPPELSADESESELDIPREPSLKRLAASPAKRGLRLPRPVPVLGEIKNPSKRRSTKERSRNSRSSLDRGHEYSLGNFDREFDENDTFQHKARSRLPRQTLSNGNENPDRATIAEKLAALEAEARQAEELRMVQSQEHEKGEEVVQVQKRRKIASQGWRKTSRRRSTLSPDELAALMGVR